MRRHEALGLLREISKAFRETICIDEVSLIDSQNQAFSDAGEPRFKIRLQTKTNLNIDILLKELLRKYGARMIKTDNYLIIYKSGYTDSA